MPEEPRHTDDTPAGVPDTITPFQRRMWRAQRVAWGVKAAFVAAALAGAFGDGPLSHVERRSPSGRTTVAWHRVVRAQAPFDIEVHGAPVSWARTPLAASPAIARRFESVRLVPDAARELAVGEAMRWEVATVPGHAVHVRITAEVRAVGRVRGALRLGDDESVPIDLLVLP